MVRRPVTAVVGWQMMLWVGIVVIVTGFSLRSYAVYDLSYPDRDVREPGEADAEVKLNGIDLLRHPVNIAGRVLIIAGILLVVLHFPF